MTLNVFSMYCELRHRLCAGAASFCGVFTMIFNEVFLVSGAEHCASRFPPI